MGFSPYSVDQKSVLFPQTPKLPKLPFVPIIHRLIHSPGRLGARENSRVQTPQTPKLHKQMSMVPGFNRPGSQVKASGDAGIWA
jgi:hypothetical protein